MQVPDSVRFSVVPVELQSAGQKLPASGRASQSAVHVRAGMTDCQVKVTAAVFIWLQGTDRMESVV